ncbi:MAG TPA: lysophospholipid acyltransferase family protein [Anaerolineae bacterium]|nr:lysophospholipid acyltransferase family protein [Anaerolineae bacterium]
MMSQASLIYYSYRVLGAVAPVVPRRLGYWLAERSATLAYRLRRSSGAALRENLSHVLGAEVDDAAVESAALGVFRNLAKNYFDLFHKHRLSTEDATATINVCGLHHLQEGLRDGRGLVVVSAHFGPFDALWQIGRRLNLPLTAPAEHLEPERLYQYICTLRDREWVRLLPVDGPLLQVFRALNRGEIVAVAGDRLVTGNGIEVEFFDAPARMPDGPVQLALRTGANILTCFAVRQRDNNVVLHIEPPLQLERTGDFTLDVKVNVRKVVARLEEWIGRYPDQWLVLEPIWGDGRHGT